MITPSLLLGLALLPIASLGLCLAVPPAPSGPAHDPAPARGTPLLTKLRRMAAKAPLVVAHRGASSRFPENTLPSFAAGLDAGAQIVELDFHATADGTLVCLHDKTLDRTTDAEEQLGGTAIPIAATPLGDLAALDAGSWKGAAHRGTRIPTLAAALDLIQARGVTMIEHKGGTPDALVELLRDKRMVEQVLVQSFDWDFLERVHALEPKLSIGALGSGAVTEERLRDLGRTGAGFVHWSARSLTTEDVATLHRHGYLLCVYTVNADIELLGGGALGLDMITTDRPSRMAALVQRGQLRRTAPR